MFLLANLPLHVAKMNVFFLKKKAPEKFIKHFFFVLFLHEMVWTLEERSYTGMANPPNPATI